jgi:hypothetical protein
MFVETGQVILPRNHEVGLCFHVPVSGEDVLCVADARVVHTGARGVGLGFRHIDKRALNALRDVMGWSSGGDVVEVKGPGARPLPRDAIEVDSWESVGGVR